jgi:hypothetical protein
MNHVPATLIAFCVWASPWGCAAVPPGDEPREQEPRSDFAHPEEQLSLELNARLPQDPETPSILRNVSIISNGTQVKPTLPGMNVSNDGRVGLTLGASTFHLLVPEKLEPKTSFVDAAAGEPIVVSPNYKQIPLHGETGTVEKYFSALCEGTTQFGSGTKMSPYVCDGTGMKASGGGFDCYELSIVTGIVRNPKINPSLRIWSAPVKVRVQNPKTASAQIVSVEADGPLTRSPVFLGVDEFFEPAITEDGQLLVFRIGGSRKDSDLHAGGTDEKINIVYSMADSSKTTALCDASRWNSINTITRAVDDPFVNKRYGFAKYPLRDAEGQLIAPGKDLGATYPWIDKKGANLFFKAIGRPLAFLDAGVAYTSYPIRCANNVSTDCTATAQATYDQESRSENRGAAMAGLWTFGRTVLFDGRISNTDFGLGVGKQYQRDVKLYRGGSGLSREWITVGSGRQNEEDPNPLLTVGNTSIIHSIEHLLNDRPGMMPKTPRDVVWLVSSQLASEEVIFDDWTNQRALIVTDMVPSWTRGVGSNESFNDGFVEARGYGNGIIRLQNAASSKSLKVPAAGLVAGAARTEPVALGGVHGRGFWLTGNNRVYYKLEAQPEGDVNWYTGVFLDGRFTNDGVPRRLLTFPDGSFINFIGTQQMVVRGIDGSGVTIDLPVGMRPGETNVGPGRYRHYGFRRNGLSVDVFVNGFLLRRLTAPNVRAGFNYTTAGVFSVGTIDGVEGVTGWIDELRVFNELVTPELACNYARGTLFGYNGVNPTYDPLILSYTSADADGNEEFSEINRVLTTDHEKYFCRVDYTSDHTVSTVLRGVKSIRFELLQPAPLKFGAPRPDESANAFCLSCHTSAESGSLGLEALTIDADTPMEMDRRRQPMQPLRRIRGNVPVKYLPGVETPITTNPLNGTLLDQWNFP